MKSVGEKIKALRESKKITLEAMGDALGIGLTTYASREIKGKFTDSDFGKILKKLGVTKEVFDQFKIPGKQEMSLSLPESIIRMEAKLDVLLSAIAELLAKQNGQTVTGAVNDLTKAVKERYDLTIAELQKSGQ